MPCVAPPTGSALTDMSPPKIAIIAAYPGEIRPLVKGWERSTLRAGGTRLRRFQRGRAIATYGGMGAGPIQQACRALVECWHPDLLISAGWAGGLRPELKTGAIVVPETVIEIADGRAFRSFCGAGILVTGTAVASPQAKRELAARFSAQAIDMEAAAVGAVAQEAAVKFLAVKAIFDEHGFPLPAFERFHNSRGRFRYGRFLAHAALRPALWPKLGLMQRRASEAAQALSAFLEKLLASDTLIEIQQQVAKLALGVPL